MKKLFAIVAIAAILASVIGAAAAQAAVAPSPTPPPAPKVTALAFPFAWVDTAFPVLVLVKNEADSDIDDPQICLDFGECVTVELPEDEACEEPWFGIGPNGYGFGIWFLQCSCEEDQTITATVMGEIDGALVSGSDSVEIELWD
jgi:hypothetical protein